MLSHRALPLVLLMACAPAMDPTLTNPGPPPVAPPPPPPTYGDAGMYIPPPPVTPGYDAGLMECAAVQVVPTMPIPSPVDIVWIIDASRSMNDEASIVQSNLNGFAGAITASGIDAHVVMITAPGFVSVPPPLGSNPAQYLYVAEDIDSWNSLEMLVYTYPRWSSFLRPGSQLHVIAVTDDESDMDAVTFNSQFMSMIGGRSYKFHSIVSPPGSAGGGGGFGWGDGGCTGPGGDASANGEQYWQLSATTGGGQYSICTPDWSTLFAQLQSAIAVAVPLPCVFDIPPAPVGMTFDSNRVNVKVTFGTGAEQVLPNVQAFERCGAAPSGWYYDNPLAPTRIVLCPQTCTTNSSDTSARVDIALGCATQLL